MSVESDKTKLFIKTVAYIILLNRKQTNIHTYKQTNK